MMSKISNFSVIIFFVFFPLTVFGQTNSSLPIATTLEVANASSTGGEVVIYDEEGGQYALSNIARDTRVYGVTAFRPALVFTTTASGTMPVVTGGATQVQVHTTNGPIARGDVLTTSDIIGTAMRADLSDDQVFAIALEDFGEIGSSNTMGIIIAEVGVEGAKALQEKRRQIEKQNTISGTSTAQTEETEEEEVSFIRIGIATVIAVGGLFFILYSFRSTIAKGVVSIGRNPRARTSIMVLALGNIIFALILCVVAIFIAVGVLILPI